MLPTTAREGRSASLAVVALALVMSLLSGCVSLAASAPDATGGPEPGVAAAAEPTIVAATAMPAAPAATPTGPPAAADPVVMPSPLSASPRSPSFFPASPPAVPAAELALGSAPPGTPDADPSIAPALSDATLEPTLAATEGVFDARTRRRLDRVLRNMVRKHDIAGLQVAIRLRNGRMWHGTAGHAEFLPDRPVEDDTVFAIASVTKTFIAALILQLAEEGKLGLDETYRRYAPDAPRARKATIRQLLSHTSGIYDYFSHPRYIRASGAWRGTEPTAAGDREHEWTYEEILDLVRGGYCKPGRCYRYSNTNYVVLGRIAEAVGKAPLHVQLRERFLEPLGLDDTYYQPAEAPPIDAAHGHWSTSSRRHEDHTRESQVVPFIAAASAAGAAGAIASTAEDLATWAAALYGGDVLTPASLRQMTTMLLPGAYGLGTDVAVFAGHRALGHRGGIRGFEASMWYFPDSGISIALASNEGNWYQRGTSMDVPMQRLVKTVLGDASGPG